MPLKRIDSIWSYNLSEKFNILGDHCDNILEVVFFYKSYIVWFLEEHCASDVTFYCAYSFVVTDFPRVWSCINRSLLFWVWIGTSSVELIYRSEVWGSCSLLDFYCYAIGAKEMPSQLLFLHSLFHYLHKYLLFKYFLLLTKRCFLVH